MVPFLHIDAGVLSQHLVNAAVFELGRLGLCRKDGTDEYGKACSGVNWGWSWEPAHVSQPLSSKCAVP